MDSQEIVNYIMNTPNNTNPAILKQMIEEKSGTQADWNQNDKNAPDYIKNRPFREEDELVVISECEVTSITTNEGWRNLTDGNGNYAYPTNCELPLATYVYGDDYVIDINGETYNLKLSQSWDGSLADVYYLGFNVAGGNNAHANLESGAKFAIFTQLGRANDFVDGETFEGSLSCYLSSDIALPATIKIKHSEKVLKQLDSKYIKDMYHTETVQKSKHLEFVGPIGGDPDDMELGELLYEHRKTAIYTVEGVNFVYKEDTTGDDLPPGHTWSVEDANGVCHTVDSIMDPGRNYYTGQIFFAPNASITVNYEVEEVHKLDAKYLPDNVFVINVYESTPDIFSNTDYGNAVKNALLAGKTVYCYDGIGYFSVAAFGIRASTTGAPSLQVCTAYSTTNGYIGPSIKTYTFAITL